MAKVLSFGIKELSHFQSISPLAHSVYVHLKYLTYFLKKCVHIWPQLGHQVHEVQHEEAAFISI
uniref:Uncharacterized protein n=1 Tax=Rhizophora mucronata TaxID=61149 RepID=A0A2P2IIK8_RHIMU